MRISIVIFLSRWERWFIVFLFVLSLGLRFSYLTTMQQDPFFEHPRLDALFHDNWAQSIASGNILGNEVFFRAPLYPYWLGAIYTLFGHSYLVPRIIQHVLGIALILLVYFLSRLLFNRATAVLASLFTATYAVLIYFEDELLFDSLLVFFTLFLFVLIYWTKRKPSLWRWFITGFLFGCICITRPTYLLFLLILLCYQKFLYLRLYGIRQTYLFAIALTIGTILPILPVTVRNYIVGQDIVLISSQGGINFYIGNNSSADGYSSSMPDELGKSWENRDVQFLVERELGYKAKPSEISNYWYKKGWQFIKSQPLDFVRLTEKKMYLFWNKLEIPNNQSFYSSWQYSSFLRWLPIGFWLIGPLGLLGMLIAWKANQGRFMIIFVLFYMFIVIAYFVCDRFRLPVIPFLCMFSGYTIVSMCVKIKYKAWGSIFGYSGLLVLFAGFTNSNLYNLEVKNEAQDYLRLGNVELDQGHYDAAIKYYQQSVRNHKCEPNVFLNWGVATLMTGQTEEAINKFHEELYYFPHSYGAFSNLSYSYFLKGQLDSTIYYGDRAIREKPYASAAYIYVAKAYLRLQNSVFAESILVHGVKLCGKDFAYGKFLLAGIYMQEGKIQLAENEYRNALVDLSFNSQPSYEPDFQYSWASKIGESIPNLRAKLYYGLGHVFVSRAQIDSAISCFTASTSINPDYADAWADLAIAYHSINSFVEADSTFDRAIRLDPENYLYWYNYGLLLGHMKRIPEAKLAFQRTLQFRPDYSPAREILIQIAKAGQ